jgi:hypothetical protein
VSTLSGEDHITNKEGNDKTNKLINLSAAMNEQEVIKALQDQGVIFKSIKPELVNISGNYMSALYVSYQGTPKLELRAEVQQPFKNPKGLKTKNKLFAGNNPFRKTNPLRQKDILRGIKTIRTESRLRGALRQPILTDLDFSVTKLKKKKPGSKK